MTNWGEGDLLANGIRIHYYRSGADKRPIVLAHGITDSGRCWPLVSQALGSKYDVITVDARGHGKSEKPETGYAREDHARDLAGLIEGLGLDRPAVLGHSMGAGSASVLAAQYPGLVGVAILEDPPWRGLGETVASPAFSHEWRARIRERKALSIEDIIAAGKLENPTWADAEFEPWSLAKHQVSPDVVGHLSDGSPTWLERVQAIRCPTLLITGDNDLGAIVTPETAAAAAKANPRVQIAHVPGAGHNIRREQFVVYMSAVNSFLTKEYPSA